MEAGVENSMSPVGLGVDSSIRMLAWGLITRCRVATYAVQIIGQLSVTPVERYPATFGYIQWTHQT